MQWCGAAARRMLMTERSALMAAPSSCRAGALPILCGRGDKKTKKGKRFKGSYGNARPKREKKIERIKDKVEVPRSTPWPLPFKLIWFYPNYVTAFVLNVVALTLYCGGFLKIGFHGSLVGIGIWILITVYCRLYIWLGFNLLLVSAPLFHFWNIDFDCVQIWNFVCIFVYQVQFQI